MARTNIDSRWTPELTISKDPVSGRQCASMRMTERTAIIFTFCNRRNSRRRFKLCNCLASSSRSTTRTPAASAPNRSARSSRFVIALSTSANCCFTSLMSRSTSASSRARFALTSLRVNQRLQATLDAQLSALEHTPIGLVREHRSIGRLRQVKPRCLVDFGIAGPEAPPQFSLRLPKSLTRAQSCGILRMD